MRRERLTPVTEDGPDSVFKDETKGGEMRALLQRGVLSLIPQRTDRPSSFISQSQLPGCENGSGD